MVVGKTLKSQAGLAQPVHTFDLLGPGLGLPERREQERRQKGDDGDYTEQFKQAERPDVAAPPREYHTFEDRGSITGADAVSLSGKQIDGPLSVIFTHNE